MHSHGGSRRSSISWRAFAFVHKRTYPSSGSPSLPQESGMDCASKGVIVGEMAPGNEKAPAVPTLLRCPISLELMTDPVTLHTGQTYERRSIEAWLAAGHATCPATMQRLPPPLELVPNHTLRRLIQEWCAVNGGSVASAAAIPAITAAAADPELIASLLHGAAHSVEPLGSLQKLRGLGRESERNRRCMCDRGAVAVAAAVLSSSSLQEFTGVEVGTSRCVSLEAREEALAILASLVSCDRVDGEVGGAELACGPAVRSLAWFLCKGSLDAKVNAARVITAIAAETDVEFDEGARVLESLGKLLREDLYPKAIKASLQALLALCAHRGHRAQAAEAGAGIVPALIELLPELPRANAERALHILELLCTAAEGLAAVAAHDLAMPVLVSQFHTISAAATEHTVSILCALCRASRGSLAAAQEAGVFAPLLLLLQIECAPCTRQKCKELVKQVKGAAAAAACDPTFFLPSITTL